MRISDWSSDVCSSDLTALLQRLAAGLRVFVTQLLEDNPFQRTPRWRGLYFGGGGTEAAPGGAFIADLFTRFLPGDQPLATPSVKGNAGRLTGAALGVARSEEHTSELQSLMRISYAVFCLKKK